MYQDKTLVCRDCGSEFVFSASEQEFYAEKGFTNEPGRCPQCRAERKQRNRFGSRGPREMYETVCSNCGVTTQVPFQPSGDRPVYCRDCYAQRRNQY
ncbi:MAG: zinc-binding protein [Firmicutes bacterium]|nr:zinc-binding protein [Bacillota bacterium]